MQNILPTLGWISAKQILYDQSGSSGKSSPVKEQTPTPYGHQLLVVEKQLGLRSHLYIYILLKINMYTYTHFLLLRYSCPFLLEYHSF